MKKVTHCFAIAVSLVIVAAAPAPELCSDIFWAVARQRPTSAMTTATSLRTLIRSRS